MEEVIYHFKVRYEFLSEQDGGRKTLPYQGYRSDFKYDANLNIAFMIHPLFEDDNGKLIPYNNPIFKKGIARMIIISESYIEFHLNKIQKGMKCYMVEGKRIVAKCEIL